MTDDWAETKAAWKRLGRAWRWLRIEWHLGRVVRLVRADDPGALVLLKAISECYGREHSDQSPR